MELDAPLRKKLIAAAIAVGTALVGLVTGIRWFTVVALAFWILTMIVVGPGRRRAPMSVSDREG